MDKHTLERTIEMWQREADMLGAALDECEKLNEELSREHSAKVMALGKRIQEAENKLQEARDE